MTINKSEVITIPKWIIIFLMPTVISAVIGYAAFRFNEGRNEQARQDQERRLDLVEKGKVGNAEFAIIQSQLNRIELKLDNHITIVK